MNLETDINILKELRFPMKALTIRMIYQIIEEHKEELDAKGGVTWLLSQIMPPRVMRQEPLVQSVYEERKEPHHTFMIRSAYRR